MKLVISLAALLLTLASSLVGQERQVDRLIDGFKGSVKRVITERADVKLVKGKQLELKRRLAEDIEYGQRGDRTRQLSYDYIGGLLSEKATYTTVDGYRVQKLDFDDAAGAILASVPGEEMSKETFDPRYDFKFKYKTDSQGRIIEEAMWSSNGKLWLRYVYSYGTTEKTEHVFDSDGKLNQKYLHKYDAEGNPIELVIYDTDRDSIAERIVYKYFAFDKHGNWIKRYETAGDEDGKFVQRPREMTYRRITYYVGDGAR